MGEAPDSIVLVETDEDVEALEVDGRAAGCVPDPDDALGGRHGEVVDALRERFPDLVGPPSADICYATQNRQDAVKKICEQATLVLVVGSKTSSNANRLVEVAKTCGADAYLIDDETDLDPPGSTAMTSSGSPPARRLRNSSSTRVAERPRSSASMIARRSS